MYFKIFVQQSKIRELEKKTELQNVHHEELMLELTALKRSQQSVVRASSSRHSSLGHSPPDSPLCSTPGNSRTVFILCCVQKCVFHSYDCPNSKSNCVPHISIKCNMHSFFVHINTLDFSHTKSMYLTFVFQLWLSYQI